MGYGDLPAEVRRERSGWFGEPWPSGICYDDDGRLLAGMRKPFPAGETCPECEEPILEGDSGRAMLYDGVIRHVHKECGLRIGAGPLAHLEQRCQHFGGTGNDTPGLTRRQEAQAVWDWVMRYGRVIP